jgi:hypothetical protein
MRDMQHHVFDGGQGTYEEAGEVWCHLCQEWIKKASYDYWGECPGPNEPCHVQG